MTVVAVLILKVLYPHNKSWTGDTFRLRCCWNLEVKRYAAVRKIAA
ncbi:hypothetical protein A2U01_0026615, partial [Trifolium medium]|nr:hypothetical protein [Trifolium medium]